jgi:hypothetical protein
VKGAAATAEGALKRAQPLLQQLKCSMSATEMRARLLQAIEAGSKKIPRKRA